MLYKCKICLKEFKQKSNYTYHINRKIQCENINIDDDKIKSFENHLESFENHLESFRIN